MILTRSTVTVLGSTSDHAEFFHLDLVAVAAQAGASDLGKFKIMIDGQEYVGVLGIYASGEPLSGGNTLVALPCPPYCAPPASPSNPVVQV